jgi:O-antigen/teichoic acid export membrane protein
MIWALLPYAITETFSTALVAGNKQNQQVLLSTVNVIVKTVACYFLILEYGIMGPAIATIIALLVSGVMQKVVVVPKLIDIHLKSIISPGLKALGAGLLMLISIYLMRNFNLIVGAILSALIYFVSLLALKIFSEDDKYYLRKVMKKTS